MNNSQDLLVYVETRTSIGQKVDLAVIRAGRKQSVRVEIGANRE